MSYFVPNLPGSDDPGKDCVSPPGLKWQGPQRVHVRAAGGLTRQWHVFVVSQVAVGFEFDKLAAVLEDAVGWVGLLLRHPPLGRVGRGSGRGGQARVSVVCRFAHRVALPARSSRPSRREGDFAMDFLDDWLGVAVGPTDGGEDGFLLLGVQFDA